MLHIWYQIYTADLHKTGIYIITLNEQPIFYFSNGKFFILVIYFGELYMVKSNSIIVIVEFKT